MVMPITVPATSQITVQCSLFCVFRALYPSQRTRRLASSGINNSPGPNNPFVGMLYCTFFSPMVHIKNANGKKYGILKEVEDGKRGR